MGARSRAQTYTFGTAPIMAAPPPPPPGPPPPDDETDNRRSSFAPPVQTQAGVPTGPDTSLMWQFSPPPNAQQSFFSAGMRGSFRGNPIPPPPSQQSTMTATTTTSAEDRAEKGMSVFCAQPIPAQHPGSAAQPILSSPYLSSAAQQFISASDRPPIDDVRR